MNATNPKAQELGNILSTTDDKKRLAAYAGCIYGYVKTNDKEFEGSNIAQKKMSANDIYYEVNDIAMIDKEQFISLAYKFISFLDKPLESVGFATCFDDISGVNYHFGKEVVEAINCEIETFNKAKLAYLAASK